jgi:hypothetical protein
MRTSDKVRENRLRRMAERQGLRLVKSRRRDPHAIGYGGYMLVYARTGKPKYGDEWWPFCLDMNDVEERLTRVKS